MAVSYLQFTYYNPQIKAAETWKRDHAVMFSVHFVHLFPEFVYLWLILLLILYMWETLCKDKII